MMFLCVVKFVKLNELHIEILYKRSGTGKNLIELNLKHNNSNHPSVQMSFVIMASVLNNQRRKN